MIHNIASHIADNQIERDVNGVERFIQAAGDRGRTWGEFWRNFRHCEGTRSPGDLRGPGA
jgi:hypothetical protein